MAEWEGLQTGAPSRELGSWKEIATYLGVSVRTAQTWERELGMPVLRIAGRSRVRALTNDLDAWKFRNRTAPETQSEPRWGLRLLVAALALALGVALLSARRPPPRPFALRIDSTGLTVLDEPGKTLWTKTFPAGIVPAGCFGAPPGKVIDVDGDGSQEVLFIPNPAFETTESVPLICYNADGTERWRFLPGRAVRTRAGEFAAEFRACSFVPLRQGGQAKIALGSLHRLYYPYQVAFLDAEGRLLREYWHPGHLQEMVLHDVEGDGRKELLLAGVNNSRKQATVVVLDPERGRGAAREDNPAYVFDGFETAREKARLFFPVSVLTGAGRYNRASRIDTAADRLTVHVMERTVPERATVFYEFGRGLTPRGLSVSDDFAALLRTEFPRIQVAEEEKRLQSVMRE